MNYELKINPMGRAFAYLLLVSVIFYGCQEQKDRTVEEPPTANEYSTVVIDSCEYLQYYADLKYALAYVTYDYKAKFLTHKGNCKYCTERRKTYDRSRLTE